MSKKKFLFLFLSFYLLLGFKSGWSEESVHPPDFSIWLQRAYRIAVSGDLERAKMLFEKLLMVNPKNWVVYDFYANALKYRGDFDGAIAIYERALLLGQQMRPKREDEIQDRIKMIEDTKRFEESIKTLPPFSLARTIGKHQLIIRTNMSGQYYDPLAQRVAQLHRNEKQMLEKILGVSKRIPSLMNVYLFGRWIEYVTFIKDMTRQTKTGVIVNSSAYYDEDAEILAIYFNGEVDWQKVAHEMARFLLRDLYLESPSHWLDRGLAEYISLKLEKENAKSSVLRSLDSIRWLQDQGQWQSVLELFPYWIAYEHSGDLNSTLPATKIFYLKAWSLIHFFLEEEGKGTAFKSFFEQYFQYEKKEGYQTYQSVYKYFTNRLTQEQIHDLSQKWGKYTTGLTYEKV